MQQAAAAATDDRVAWLQARKSGIGGSDAAAVMGVSRWKSAYALWAEKTGLEPDTEDNEVLRWGRILEEPIIVDYERLTGRKVERLGPFSIQRHVKLPFMICTHDGIVDADDGRGPGALSVKYIGPMNTKSWEQTQGPIDYKVQLQHEMAVSNLAWGSFAVLIWGKGVRWFDVDRNDNFIEALTDTERDFWRRVEKGDPPPVDGSESTTEALKRLYPKDKGTAIDLPADAAALIRELHKLKAEKKATEGRVALLENTIKKAIGDASEARLNGRVVCTYRTVEKKSYTVKAQSYRQLRWKDEEESE